jgi:CYTH domain-containing protein
MKSLPLKKAVIDIVDIDQFYWMNSKGVWERARTWFTQDGSKRWIHTIKKSISKGVNSEDEHDITEEEYSAFVLKCRDNKDKKKDEFGRFLSKKRHIYKDDKNMTWEVDVFNSGAHIIVAEVELPKKNFKLKIPKFINEVMLHEVTQFKQFSNRSLSDKIIEEKTALETN